jgi:hypothetical protein
MKTLEHDQRIFVGERPSNTAIAKGWTWEDGRLAAAQLFDALIACGFEPAQQIFLNIFYSDRDEVNPDSVELLDAAILSGIEIVAMGNKVSKSLNTLGIQHITIVHPAARGKIRKKELYKQMIEKRLGSKEKIKS